MGDEKPQFTEAQANTQPHETRHALLRDAGFIAMATELQPPGNDDTIQKFDVISRERMLPKEIPATATSPKRYAYSPASPPEPQYTIDKSQIQTLDDGLSAWQVTGKVDANTNCQVTYYWQKGNQPGELKIKQVDTLYTNDAGNAGLLGADFGGADAAVGLNVQRDMRKPRGVDEYDCEITSYPIKATDKSGDYLVFISKSFVGASGAVENKTTETIDGKDYAYFYCTRVMRYAPAADGKTLAGLKTDTIYADPDGGTTKKLKEIKYTDETGNVVAGGKHATTTTYDITKAKETELCTTNHKPYIDPKTGQKTLIISQIVEHDYQGVIGANYIRTFYDDQQWKMAKRTNPDGTTGSKLERSQDGRTMTLNFYNELPLGPGQSKASGTFVYEMLKNGKYGLKSMEIRDSEDNPINQTTLSDGRPLTAKYNADGKVVGVEGGKFFNKGQPIAEKDLERIMTRKDVNKAWQEEFFGDQKK